MKYFFTTALAALSMASCTTNEYKVSVNFDSEQEGQTIYMRHFAEDFKFAVLDSAIVENGSVSFSGVADSSFMVILTSAKSEICPVVVENKKISISVDSLGVAAYAGSAINDSINGYVVKSKFFATEQRRLYSEMRAIMADESKVSEMAELDSQYNALDSVKADYTNSFISANSDNIAGAFALYNNVNNLSASEITTHIETAGPVFANSTLTKFSGKRAEIFRRSEVGAMFTDFSMNDINGNEASLSDYVGKGKYVFVDFWASWCGPCCREMPNVVEAYKKYSPKGLEIVGVSFDNNEASWKEKVSHFKMTWPQLSDLKGWQCLAGEVYGVRSIPTTILFDPEGKVVAKNLRGDALEEAFAEIFCGK